jgi:small subunit ribosomal protein S18
LGQLDRALRFDETVIRYMTVVIGEHGKIKEPSKKLEKPKKNVEGREEHGPIRIDYKDVMTLAPFLAERGKIAPQRQNRLTAKEQRFLAQSIKRARQLALLSYNMALPGREIQTMETGGMV